MKLEIGEVARRAGVRPSAVRYYEKRGLIAPARGSGGRREFTLEAVERLVLIRYAKQLGFTLAEIRKLLTTFADARWSTLAAAKIEEIDALAQRLASMRDRLQRIAQCQCGDVGQCAHALAEKHCQRT